MYFSSAKVCVELANNVDQITTELVSALNGCGAMAGAYPSGKQWSSLYDEGAYTTVAMARRLASTLNSYGAVVMHVGYVYWMAEYKANRDPHKGPPPDEPLPPPGPAYGPWAVQPSAGGTGQGLDTDLAELVDKIGVAVPDGDTGKLETAAAAWKKFIGTDAAPNYDYGLGDGLGYVADQLKQIAEFFHNVDSPDIRLVEQHFRTLETSTRKITTTGDHLRTMCQEHTEALAEFRKKLEDFLWDLVKDLAEGVLISIALSFVTFGVGAAVGLLKDSATIAKAAKWIREAITAMREAKAFRHRADELQDARDAQQGLEDVARLKPEGEPTTPKPKAPTAPAVTSRADAEKILDQGAKLEKDKDSIIKSKAGGDAQAERDFDNVTQGYPVKTYPNGTKVAHLPDGSDISLRGSSDTRKTISIQQKGSPSSKYRYDP